MKISQSKLKEILHYDEKSGLFRWLEKVSWNTFSGAIAGHVDDEGYVRITLLGVKYRAHRLAWLYVNGEWPPCKIDHKNRIRSDNRINNLRLATDMENSQNQGAPHKNNKTSGHLGVSWDKRECKWRAQIRINGKQTSVGYFETEELANAAYMKKKRDAHHGFVEVAANL